MKLVLSTCPPNEAPAIAKRLLEDRLIACCNILPQVTSMYWWEGRISTDAEALLVMKAPDTLIDQLVATIKDIHPYEVPEVVVLPVEGGFEGYLSWVEQSCRAALGD